MLRFPCALVVTCLLVGWPRPAGAQAPTSAPGVFARVHLVGVQPPGRPVKLAGTLYGLIHERLFRFSVPREGPLEQFGTEWHQCMPWDRIPAAAAIQAGESTAWSDWSAMFAQPRPQMTLALSLWQDGLPAIGGPDGGNVSGFEAIVQFASAPDESATVTSIRYHTTHHCLGLYLPATDGPLETWGPAIRTLREYARDRLRASIAAGARAFSPGRLFPITADCHRGYHLRLYDPQTEDLEARLHRLLGVNQEALALNPDDFSSLHPASEEYVAALRRRLPAPEGRFFVKVGDEPGIPRPEEARKDPITVAAFRGWLQQLGVSPTDVGADDWPGVTLLGREEVRTIPQARLCWHTASFLQELTALKFRAITQACHRAWPGRATVGTDAYFGGWTRTPDYFVESRLEAFDQQIHHYGSGDPWGPRRTTSDLFLADMLRSASQFGHIRPGMLWFVCRIAQHEGVALSGLTALAHGLQRIYYYGYGPLYSGWEWFSDDRYKLDAFVAASETSRLAARYETFLLEGRRPRARVAQLLSRSADLWADTPASQLQDVFGFGQETSELARQLASPLIANSASGWDCERRMIHAALQWANIPTDLVPEEEVEAGRLRDYAVLYVTAPNLSVAAQRRVAEWVRQGGVLYLGPQAATRDELNRFHDLFSALCGTAKAVRVVSAQQRGRFRAPDAPDDAWQTRDHWSEEEAASMEPLGELVTTPAAGGDPFVFPALGCLETVSAPNATVLATCADGTPTVALLQVGSGHVVKAGTCLGAAYARSASPGFHARRQVANPPFTHGDGITAYWRRVLDTRLQDLILFPTRLAAVDRPVRCSLPGIDAGLYQLPEGQGALLLLGAYSSADLTELRVEVSLDAPCPLVSTFSGQTPRVAWDGSTAHLHLDLSNVVEAVEFRPYPPAAASHAPTPPPVQ